MIDLEQLKRDREAGTPGPWMQGFQLTGMSRFSHYDVFDPDRKCIACVAGDLEGEANLVDIINASRIARVPDLEEMVLEQADEITRLRADLAAAREQVAGAYFDAMQSCNSVAVSADSSSALAAVNACQKKILQRRPADATAALEARDARMIKSGYETGFNEGYEKRQFEEWEVRAEERAKIDLLVGAATALEANLGVKGVNVGSLRVRLHEALIALHTPESRARAPRSVDANKQADIGSKEGE